jgi:hypothetical protein
MVLAIEVLKYIERDGTSDAKKGLTFGLLDYANDFFTSCPTCTSSCLS